MNLSEKTTHEATVRTVMQEDEILRILASAVASKAGLVLEDESVTVRRGYLTRSTGSMSFEATIEIVRDLSAPKRESDSTATLDCLAAAICRPIVADEVIASVKAGPFAIMGNGKLYTDGMSIGVNGSIAPTSATYIDHKNLSSAIRSVATLEDGRPQWEISKDGTSRFGRTTHLPDGTIRHEGEYGLTIGPL